MWGKLKNTGDDWMYPKPLMDLRSCAYPESLLFQRSFLHLVYHAYLKQSYQIISSIPELLFISIINPWVLGVDCCFQRWKISHFYQHVKKVNTEIAL